jgi:hypothetical protein
VLPWQQVKADSVCMTWRYEPKGTMTNHDGRVPAPPDEHCGTPT